MRVTMQQIADKAGVSRGTVDRALNHRGRIDPDVEAMILRIADELGYTPKHKKSQNTKSYVCKIGIVTQLSNAPFMKRVLEGIEEAGAEFADSGVQIILEKGVSVDEEEQLNLIDKVIHAGVDALAVMPVETPAIRSRINEIIHRLHIPVVTFNTDVVGIDRLAFVGMDNFESGRTAAGLMGMLAKSSGRILIITGFFSNTANNNRVAGFTEELATSFPHMEISGVHACFESPDSVQQCVEKALLGSPGIDGIFIVCGGQEGVYAALHKLNLEERPYVIVYDQIPMNEKALLKGDVDFLIDQNGFLQGYQAVKIICNMLLHHEIPPHKHYYTDITIKTRYNLYSRKQKQD